VESLEAFEHLLTTAGPWIAGMDFPFGQPRKLVANLGWSQDWSGYVGEVANLGKAAFEKALTDYRNGRAKGDKQHLRATDKLAGSCSPMMLAGVPVAKMFFVGAPRLLKSGVDIRPCRPKEQAGATVVEAYPKLVAQKWIGAIPYKSDSKKKQQAEHRDARQRIIKGLCSKYLRCLYGCDFLISKECAESAVEDPTGDRLDSILCALQAAWAYEQRLSASFRYGIPTDCDSLEGWIVDPAQLL